MVSSAYLRLLIFLLAILIPACVSSSLAFRMMYSTYKLNKQGDNIQPWCTPFPIWNQSVVLIPVLTVASWPAYRFLRRQVGWSGIPTSLRIIQFVVIHTFKGFGIFNKAKIDVLLELCCFFDHPADVGNMISGSSAFSKSSLNIWKFMIHILLKPVLENFDLYFASLWNEHNYVVVWRFFGIVFFEIGMKTGISSPVATAKFSKFAGVLSAALSQYHLSGFEMLWMYVHIHMNVYKWIYVCMYYYYVYVYK